MEAVVDSQAEDNRFGGDAVGRLPFGAKDDAVVVFVVADAAAELVVVDKGRPPSAVVERVPQAAEERRHWELLADGGDCYDDEDADGGAYVGVELETGFVPYQSRDAK